MQTLVRQLSGSIHLRDLEPLLEPVGEEPPDGRRRRCPSTSALLARTSTSSQAMVEVLGELWRFRDAHSSRDLNPSLRQAPDPGRTLQQGRGQQRRAAPPSAPAGICLFCGNVYSPQTADRLLADMKEAVILTLVDGSGQERTEAAEAR